MISCNRNLQKGIEAAACVLRVTFSKKNDSYVNRKMLFSEHRHYVVKRILINPRLWAHCARPEPTQHISHSLIPHCFSSPFIPCTADVLFSSPALILPRAEHSSPCSNTASRVPALVKILPFSFAFFLFFNFRSAVLPPLECRGTFPKSRGGENDALSVALLSSRLKDSKIVLRRN